MDYYQKRSHKAKMHAALCDLGWKTFGYKEDNSDSMTDYYDPATWEGVATFERDDGKVVILQVDAPADRSGYVRCKHVMKPGPTCPRCNGGGSDPSFWTLAHARQHDVDFNVCHMDMQHTGLIRRPGSSALIEHEFTDTMVSLPAVQEKDYTFRKSTMRAISPLMFHDNGFLRCVGCGGSGHKPGEMEAIPIEKYPDYTPMTGRTCWQLECDGAVIDSGCTMWSEQASTNALKWTRIARFHGVSVAPAGESAESAANVVDGEAVTLRRNEKQNGIELVFPTKPTRAVLNRLTDLNIGMRWSRKTGAWYVKYTPDRMRLLTLFANSLNGVTSAPPAPAPVVVAPVVAPVPAPVVASTPKPFNPFIFVHVGDTPEPAPERSEHTDDDDASVDDDWSPEGDEVPV
jgi:hypothetical protein